MKTPGGADRIVNAIAAIDRYGYPLIIVLIRYRDHVCAINDGVNIQGRHARISISTGPFLCGV